MANKTSYEVIVIGGGAAGLTAGIYTARAGLSTLLLEKELIGGQIANVDHIENYPGFPEGINGFELAQLMQKQAEKYGVEISYSNADGIESANSRIKKVKTPDGVLEAKAVILTGAAKHRKLNIPGEAEYSGKGVSYCATCDGPLFRDQHVAIAGGGNSAITEALHITRFASHVTVIHRRDQLRADQILKDRAFAEPKIKFVWDSAIESLEGNEFLQTISLSNLKTGKKSKIDARGLFVSIGFDPDTGYLRGVVPLDAEGRVITNAEMETDVPGIFAAGDIRAKLARQVITAAGDGATAAISVERYFTKISGG